MRDSNVSELSAGVSSLRTDDDVSGETGSFERAKSYHLPQLPNQGRSSDPSVVRVGPTSDERCVAFGPAVLRTRSAAVILPGVTVVHTSVPPLPPAVLDVERTAFGAGGAFGGPIALFAFLALEVCRQGNFPMNTGFWFATLTTAVFCNAGVGTCLTKCFTCADFASGTEALDFTSFVPSSEVEDFGKVSGEGFARLMPTSARSVADDDLFALRF